MGLFSQIFGSDRPDGIFRSETQHLTNKVDQTERNRDRILSLRADGIGKKDRRLLEVYFITNTKKKAQSLISELSQIRYECRWSRPEERNGEYLIAGRTCELRMDDESISEWTNLMCELAATQDCEFEHWTLGAERNQSGNAL